MVIASCGPMSVQAMTMNNPHHILKVLIMGHVVSYNFNYSCCDNVFGCFCHIFA